MTSGQVVEMLVTKNCPCRDLTHPDNHTSSRRDTSPNWFSFSQSHFTEIQFTKLPFISVWLVTDPRLYFPLNQDVSQSARGQKGKSLENVCLWRADTTNLKKYFTLKEKFDGICQVELKVSNIGLLPSHFVTYYNIESTARN